jgi:putative two-component system response regulator
MHPHSPATILVVDDIAENITTLAGALRDHYRVLFATNGSDTLATVRREKVDLILLDVMMPDMDGYEVCRRLKADLMTHDIPLIFVTAMHTVIDELRGLKCGAIDYLHKPCAGAIVRKRVQLHLEHCQQSRALEQSICG